MRTRGRAAPVSLLERRVLKTFAYKKTPLLTAMTLRYLQSRSAVFNAAFRAMVLRLGARTQGWGARAAKWLPEASPLLRQRPFSLLRSKATPPSPHTLQRILPPYGSAQALLLRPPDEPTHTVFYFVGCGSERLHAEIGKPSLYILLKTGCQVVVPPPALCCGFPLEANARTDEHRRQVLSNTIVFSQIREMFRYLTFDACVVSCGTCLEQLHKVGLAEIFGARLTDVSAFAVDAGLPVRLENRYSYHRPCHDSLEMDAPLCFLPL